MAYSSSVDFISANITYVEYKHTLSGNSWCGLVSHLAYAFLKCGHIYYYWCNLAGVIESLQ